MVLWVGLFYLIMLKISFAHLRAQGGATDVREERRKRKRGREEGRGSRREEEKKRISFHVLSSSLFFSSP